MLGKQSMTMLAAVAAIALIFGAALVNAIEDLDTGADENLTKVNVGSTEDLEGTYVIVDTGQTTYYDDKDEITAPAEGEDYYGQDAQYEGVQPDYQDNGDGTLTDLNTGLMWQQDPGNKMTFEDAVDGIDTFDLAGYDDWRLPTIKELYSLILFSGEDVSGSSSADDATPFIDADYFDFEYDDESEGDRIIDAQYWSSTEYVSTTMNNDATAFGVNFADGRIKGYPTENGPGGEPKENFVLYVRGNTDYGENEFVDNGDGTVTDLATGLMWMQDDSGEGMDWYEALEYAEDLEFAGYDDWYLPNAKELQSIVDYSRSPATTDSAAIDPVFDVTEITDEGDDTNYPFYWTSTTHAKDTGAGDFAVYVAFGEGLGFMETPDGDTVLMDVHGAGCQRSDPKTGDADDWSEGNGPQGDVVRIDNFVRAVRVVDIDEIEEEEVEDETDGQDPVLDVETENKSDEEPMDERQEPKEGEDLHPPQNDDMRQRRPARRQNDQSAQNEHTQQQQPKRTDQQRPPRRRNGEGHQPLTPERLQALIGA